MANDLAPEPDRSLSDLADGVPAWLTITLGGVIAALMGAMRGGALHI